MDYLYYLRSDHASLVDPRGREILRLQQKEMEYMIGRGFMASVRDFRGLWSWLYDLGKVTEADRIILMR